MMRKQLSGLAILALTTFVAAPYASGVEVLLNGGLETTVSPPGWVQTETVTGLPGTPVSLSEQLGTANSPNDLDPAGNGIQIKPFAGNVDQFLGQNQKVNFTLSQTSGLFPPSIVGQTLTLKGDTFLGSSYSGSVNFLDPLSPSDPGGTGTVPSPTTTRIELAFLNSSSAVIGTPVVTDLRMANMTAGTFDTWVTNTLTGVAPAGTSRVRATFSATDMVDNFGFTQTLLTDNFSLRASGSAATERLTNGNLNTPGSPANWTLTESPSPVDNASIIGFAHHPEGAPPSTGQGLWLRAFSNGDATLQQTLVGVPGGDYTFKGWSRWEGGYSGGVITLDANSPSGAIPSPTQTTMQLAFLDAGGLVIGTPVTLNLRTQQMNDNTWREHVLNGIAPAGTASVRVTASALMMLANIDVGGALGNQSAFFDDFSLDLLSAGQPGDFDGDSDVDGNDFLLIQRGLGTTTTAADFTTWKANFGVGGAVPAVGAVPEPATIVVAAFFALAAAFGVRRRAA